MINGRGRQGGTLEEILYFDEMRLGSAKGGGGVEGVKTKHRARF